MAIGESSLALNHILDSNVPTDALLVIAKFALTNVPAKVLHRFRTSNGRSPCSGSTSHWGNCVGGRYQAECEIRSVDLVKTREKMKSGHR